MRRDIGFYIEANIQQVYQAYLKAAVNEPFGRTCDEQPFHTISFGVNYSFKYNMNGGSCHIHFMPYGNGTAVNIRFSLAQGFGARYEKYAQDLNNAMQVFLPVVPQPATYDMDVFLKPENQVKPGVSQQSTTSVAPVAPIAAPISSYCTNCGNPHAPNTRFCSRCGTPVSAPPKKVCPNCQTPAQDNAAFCTACGTRL